MKATYNPLAKIKYTTSHRKDNGKVFFSSYSIIDLDATPYRDGTTGKIIEARCYGTGSLNTCCLWVNRSSTDHAESIHTSGSGKAGGYGYHRPSQAMANAISNAGFELSQDIGGVGESAMREAMLALAECVGIKRPAIVESYQ